MVVPFGSTSISPTPTPRKSVSFTSPAGVAK